jgi:hypothetical protein
MALMGLTGALMGVAASVAGRIGKRSDDHRLAQLEAYVGHLESRLRVAESLLDHWRSEARRLARENRELRVEAMRQADLRNCSPGRAAVLGGTHGLEA